MACRKKGEKPIFSSYKNIISSLLSHGIQSIFTFLRKYNPHLLLSPAEEGEQTKAEPAFLPLQGRGGRAKGAQGSLEDQTGILV